tara:strand:- start:229 stop:540 length:312 start_codon:yes stop_codon:yes gene_type:complete
MSQKPFLKSRFFKLPQHKTFDFPARYYDVRKEKAEKAMALEETDNYSQRIKSSFTKKNEYKKWNQNWETIRMVIIFSILIFGFVFIYSQIDEVLEILTNTTSK